MSDIISAFSVAHIFSFQLYQSPKMEGLLYNVTGGYVEGIVRGYRNTLLTGQNYGNLCQCETIDGTDRA